MLFCYIYLIIYIERTKASRRKKKGKRKTGDGRGTRQRIPPPSSPVPRLSSVSPAVLTIRTIASAHPLTQSRPEADGRQQKEGQRLELSAILPPLACVPLPAAPFCLPCSLFVLISSARSCLSFCPPRPLCQVVRGRADHQPGQAIPSRSSCRPSPPCRG